MCICTCICIHIRICAPTYQIVNVSTHTCPRSPSYLPRTPAPLSRIRHLTRAQSDGRAKTNSTRLYTMKWPHTKSHKKSFLHLPLRRLGKRWMIRLLLAGRRLTTPPFPFLLSPSILQQTFARHNS